MAQTEFQQLTVLLLKAEGICRKNIRRFGNKPIVKNSDSRFEEAQSANPGLVIRDLSIKRQFTIETLEGARNAPSGETFAGEGRVIAAGRPSRTLRRLLRAPACLYHWRLGWLLGYRFLLLVHVGRRSGRRHRTVLEVVEYRPQTREAVVISAFGPNADWLRNIEAAPHPEVVIGSQRFTAVHRRLGADEAERVLAGYERRNRLAAPIIRAVLSRLLGWRYDGSAAHRRRLAAQLPLIAFRPQA